MIVILDNNMGNTGSVLNMIKRVGGNATVSSDKSLIAKASKLLLPGIGAFDHGIENLTNADFFPTLEFKVTKEKTPFLGICLGMQMLFNKSEEGRLQGLGWIKGEVKRFNFDSDRSKELKIPHMGWNSIYSAKENKLIPSDEPELRYYFVHSYHVVCEQKEDILAFSNYGYEFTCAVEKENVYGVQFHPEKSHRFGMSLIKNFIQINYA